ncbi:hypothetical protein BDZ90DRAFT_221676 [Jaminaea rosea]|uniref:PCI domain-containing protein n=1 Tax=Jaminaea rosea TaxID=1569628 RepID=A0A316UN06_9BASI|nr:hypothetical protein BDZ90DRAFT_221676 [Jaminaea rosea]PWN26646.1 hypothetical protein BDZ90DRAFT_221676 [Jaminaea rosea]
MASSSSSSSSSLRAQHSALLSAFQSSSADPKSLGSQLTKLKIALTQQGLLAPRPDDPSLSKDDLLLARDVLEVGAFWSIRVKDVRGFERYMDLLRVFYTDLSAQLPPSSNHEPLLGLTLLRLLASNAIAQFHLILETLPPSLLSSSPYLQHPVHLERCLMEGSYSKVWRSRAQVPREEYRYFVEELMGTIRGEIASCEEKAYSSLPMRDAATLLFFESAGEVSKFAAERGWQINPSTQTVHFTPQQQQQQGNQLDPKRAMIASNLQFARELESIV